MKTHSRLWINGFEVLSEPVESPPGSWKPGLCRCGGCEAVMTNVPTARDTHREGCPELRRLEGMAERAAKRSAGA